MRNLKKVVVVVALVGIVALAPIFRWNLESGIQGNYKHSIAQSLQNEAIPTVEMVVGNIYDTIQGN